MLKGDSEIYQYIHDSNMATQGVLGCVKDIRAAAELIANAFESGNKLLLCGNGGSAADCQHMAAELVPQGWPAIALTTDTSFLTAYSNDFDFDFVFERQVLALGKAGDMLLGISTSGESFNVVEAIRIAASSRDMGIIALTGENGIAPRWPIDEFINVSIKVPSTNTQHIQEAHIMIEHIIVELIEGHLDNN